ncbi:MAG: hypothetical protein LBS97_04545 [Treponema sp.]|jgi:hypothetical protein|nr:hypothetical protein [Treponema sp.]
MKYNVFVCAVLIVFLSGCPEATDTTELPWTFAPGITDKSAYNTTGEEIRAKAALEVTGSQDPLLALNYRLDNAYGPYFFDYVVLTWAKMTVTKGSGKLAFGLDLSEIQSILNDKSAKIAPLQAKGMKVLLGVTNGGGGITFANLPYNYREAFAKTIKDTLDRYGLNGVEFNDQGAGAGAYPSMGAAEYYDPASDEGDGVPDDGSTVSIGSASQVLAYWKDGALNYSAFLTYFRHQEHDTGTTAAIIGSYADNPILIRETGFAGGSGRTNYMDQWIRDDHRPQMEFISVTDQVNYYVGATVPPFNDGSGSFGWEGTGASVMKNFVTHMFYAPGIIDLSTVTTGDLSYFGRRFGWGNQDYDADEDYDAGYAYGLIYFSNLTEGSEDVAAKLSLASKWVYGPRNVDLGPEVSTDAGPEVLYAGR